MDSRRRTIELTNYMSVEGANSEKGSIYKNTGLLPSEQLLEIMAVCHSLTYVKETMIGNIAYNIETNLFNRRPIRYKNVRINKMDFGGE